MWNRQTNTEFQQNNYEPNRRALRAKLAQGHEFGILAYEGEEVVGWAALAPRSEYPGSIDRRSRSRSTIRRCGR